MRKAFLIVAVTVSIVGLAQASNAQSEGVYTVYNLFKFLHVAAVIVWIGSVFTLSFINARLARERDRAALVSISRQSSFYGRAIVGPAAAITLVSGIVMIAILGLGFDTLWIIWGLAGIFGNLVIGAAFIRPVNVKLSNIAPTSAPGDPSMMALQRRLATLTIINLVLLLSAVWAMVFKPALGA
jgi:putative copper export protein